MQLELSKFDIYVVYTYCISLQHFYCILCLPLIVLKSYKQEVFHSKNNHDSPRSILQHMVDLLTECNIIRLLLVQLVLGWVTQTRLLFQHTRVEWFSTFSNFRNVFNSQKSANLAVQGAAKFSCSKNHRDLNNQYFFKLANVCLPFTLKNIRQKKKKKNYCWGPKMGKMVIDLDKAKINFFLCFSSFLA